VLTKRSYKSIICSNTLIIHAIKSIIWSNSVIIVPFDLISSRDVFQRCMFDIPDELEGWYVI